VRQQHYHLVRTFQHAPDTNQQEPNMHQTQISKNPKPNNTAAGMQRIYTYLGFRAFVKP
jgi:hypothetical protein